MPDDHHPAMPHATAADGQFGTHRLLRSGSRSEDVRHAQVWLNAHGAAPPLTEDGIFGPLTRRGTIAFQNSHALTPDGVIGPRTSASLEGPTDVGGSSGQSRNPPAGPQPGNVLRYDTAAYTIPPPPAGATKATLNQQVQQRQSSQPPDLGPTVTVTACPPTPRPRSSSGTCWCNSASSRAGEPRSTY